MRRVLISFLVLLFAGPAFAQTEELDARMNSPFDWLLRAALFAQAEELAESWAERADDFRVGYEDGEYTAEFAVELVDVWELDARNRAFESRRIEAARLRAAINDGEFPRVMEQATATTVARSLESFEAFVLLHGEKVRAELRGEAYDERALEVARLAVMRDQYGGEALENARSVAAFQPGSAQFFLARATYGNVSVLSMLFDLALMKTSPSPEVDPSIYHAPIGSFVSSSTGQLSQAEAALADPVAERAHFDRNGAGTDAEWAALLEVVQQQIELERRVIAELDNAFSRIAPLTDPEGTTAFLQTVEALNEERSVLHARYREVYRAYRAD